MPNNILLNIPSATQSNLTACKAGIDIAAAHNFYGVRVAAGTNAYGGKATGDTQYLVAACTYAYGKVSKFSVTLNINPKYNGAYIVSVNGGVPVQVPNIPTSTGVLDWCVTWWQNVVDALRSTVLALGGNPLTFLEFEFCNELNIGGVSDPVDNDGTHTTYPPGTYPDGTIVPPAFVSIDYVSSRVTFYGIPTIGWNFEGSGTATATVEINSFTGTHAAAIVARCTKLGTNRYADAPAVPYDPTACKAAYSLKLNQQLNRIAANATIGAKTVVVREFGFDRERSPACTKPNTVRNDLIQQVEAEMAITEGGFFCAFDLTPSNTGAGSAWRVYAYEYPSLLPQDGITVAA